MNKVKSNIGNPLASMSLGDIAWGATVLFILIGFLTTVGFSSATYLSWFCVILFLAALEAVRHRNSRLNNKNMFCIFVLCTLTLLFLILNGYGAKYAISVVCIVVGLFLLTGLMGATPPAWAQNLFYYVSTFALAVTLAVYLHDPTIFANFGDVNKANDLAPLLYGAQDKNRTALYIFLYLAFSIKNKKVAGAIIGLIYPFIYFGRQYIMMLACFLIVLLVLHYSSNKFQNKCIAFIKKPGVVFVLFILGGIFIALLSFYWMNNVVSQGIQEYKTGLNDGSNALRMSSIKYVIEHISADPLFLFRGYDESFLSVFGISEVGETGRNATFYISDMWRMVQPHNEAINMFAREGLLFTLCYFFSISRMLCGLIKDHFDLALILSFMLGCLFLHFMFTKEMLVLFVFVLASKKRPIQPAHHQNLSWLP